jgi:competence protein ComEC
MAPRCPAALVTLLAFVTWPAIAPVPAVATALVLHGGVLLVRGFGAMEWGDVRVAMPTVAQSAWFYALLGIAILCTRCMAWQRKILWGTLACAAMIAAAVIAVAPRAMQHPQNALLVEALDVGQGDALLVITPDGKTLLIDSGGFGGGPRSSLQEFDIGEEVVAPALWARGIRHLDVVALSHAHSDHMGGMSAVLRDFHPGELWVGSNPPAAAYEALLQQAAQLQVRVRSFHAGDAFAFGAAQVRVLAPLPNYRPGAEPANNDSLVLRVAYGATSALFEGDAEAPVESAIAVEPDVASTLLKVGHHGSKTSTHRDFLAKVRPQWAVISCGLHNHYGHPAPQTLDALESAHVRTARIDLLGATCFALDGNQVHEDAGCTQ